MFQSLSRDSGHLNQFPRARSGLNLEVSIPQSGFGAFEPIQFQHQPLSPTRFQSLSRDSGHLNYLQFFCAAYHDAVSIPQSGFGAFEPLSQMHTERVPFWVSIPQSGFGAFELAVMVAFFVWVGWVSIPQSGFGAFEPPLGRWGSLCGAVFQSLSRDSGHLNSL